MNWPFTICSFTFAYHPSYRFEALSKSNSFQRAALVLSYPLGPVARPLTAPAMQSRF
jgi:hypothetical protein